MGEISTREKILGAALDLFSEKGYDATSVDEIAEAIGIKGPSLYKHFKGKEDILNSVLENGKKYQQLHFSNVGDVSNTPKSLKALKDSTMTYMNFVINDSIVIKFRKLFMMEQYRNERIAELATRIFVTGIGAEYTDIFSRMMENGLIKGDAPEALALEYISPITLFIHLCDRQPDKKAYALERIEMHIDHFCNIYGEK